MGLDRLAPYATALALLPLDALAKDEKKSEMQPASFEQTEQRAESQTPRVEAILASIQCDTALTVDGAVVDEGLFYEAIKCGEIESLELTHSGNSANLEITLNSGETLAITATLDFGEELKHYLLAQDVSVLSSSSKSKFETVNDFLGFLVRLSVGGILTIFLGSILLSLIAPKKAEALFNLVERTKPKGRRFEVEYPEVKLEDVGGINSIKAELKDLVDLMKKRDELVADGKKIPKGVLLSGNPGVGKTLLARAFAGETGLPLIQVSGAQFNQKYSGESEKMVEDLVEQARQTAREQGGCVLFIDEFDSAARQRTGNVDQQWRNDQVNQLLVCIDRIKASENIVIFGATNHKDNLDSAVIRPGRFDRDLHIPDPDVKARAEILEKASKKHELSEDIDFEVIASRLQGMSGADIASVVDEAVMIAYKEETALITADHFDRAIDIKVMGYASDIDLDPKEEKRIAFHEAGHALAAHRNEGSTVHRVTVVPRGESLGLTVTPPVGETKNHLRADFEGHIRVLLAGRIAEVIALGNDSAGASSDLKRATIIATQMVMEFGWRPREPKERQIGFASPSSTTAVVNMPKIGFRFTDSKVSMSPEISGFIDEILRNCGEEVYAFLLENRAALTAVTNLLVANKTITGDEFRSVLDGLKGS